VSPLAQSFLIREQAKCRRRLGRDCAGQSLRDSIFELADQYAAPAAAPESRSAVSDRDQAA
jgi:hypothetical protein